MSGFLAGLDVSLPLRTGLGMLFHGPSKRCIVPLASSTLDAWQIEAVLRGGGIQFWGAHVDPDDDVNFYVPKGQVQKVASVLARYDTNMYTV